MSPSQHLPAGGPICCPDYLIVHDFMMLMQIGEYPLTHWHATGKRSPQENEDNAMFRITRVYKNAQIELWKISGRVRPSQLTDWSEALKTLPRVSGRQIIIDCCEVAYLSPEAAGRLIDHITADTFIANSPAPVRNMICAAGFSAQVLG